MSSVQHLHILLLGSPNIILLLATWVIHWFLKYHLKKRTGKVHFLFFLFYTYNFLVPKTSRFCFNCQNKEIHFLVKIRFSECQLSWLRARMTIKKLIIEAHTLLNCSIAAQLYHTERQMQCRQFSPCPLSASLVPSLLLWIHPSLSFFPALAPLNKAFSETKQAKRKRAALNWHLKTMRLFTLLLYAVLLFGLRPDYLPLLGLW